VRRFSPAAALAGGGLALATLLSLFAVWLGDRWTGDAAAALGNPPRAIMLAKRARSVDPLAVLPLYYEALANEEPPYHLTRARDLLLEATAEQPQNPQTWYWLGYFDLHVIGCARHALTELNRFYELDSQNPAVKEKDTALRIVNSGVPRC